MKIVLDFFDEKFCIKDADFSKVHPFSHAKVIVNCDLPRNLTNGPLERKVEAFLSQVTGLNARWDNSSELIQMQQVSQKELPRISKLGMGINFNF